MYYNWDFPVRCTRIFFWLKFVLVAAGLAKSHAVEVSQVLLVVQFEQLVQMVLAAAAAKTHPCTERYGREKWYADALAAASRAYPPGSRNTPMPTTPTVHNYARAESSDTYKVIYDSIPDRPPALLTYCRGTPARPPSPSNRQPPMPSGGFLLFFLLSGQ